MIGLRAAATRAVTGVAGVSLGAAGGYLFFHFGTPLPWLLGSLALVAAASLAGRRVTVLPGGREVGLATVGTAVGLYFTPAVVAALAAHLPVILIAALVPILLGAVCASVLRRIARLDPLTAYFACVPGGMTEMLLLGERLGARAVEITIAQVVRVTLVVAIIPVALAWTGGLGAELGAKPPFAFDGVRLALLLAACLGFACVLNRVGMTNAWLLGPVALTAVLAGIETPLSAMPSAVSAAAQVLIGTGLGQRFRRADFARSPRVVVGAIASTLLLLAMCALLALALARLTGLPLASLVAATAPGGLAEMAITAKVLGLGVPLVIAFHVSRLVMITLCAMPVFRLLQRVHGRRVAAGE